MSFTETMMISQPLDSLDAWVAYFSDADLPVLRHTVHQLDSLRENADKVNARVLSGIILSDPLMTLRVLAYIETNRRKRQTTDITTIERALMMIGIHPFFRDFQDLPLVEDRLKPHPKALLGLLKVITRARNAAHWARDWAAVRHDLDIDEITVAALLHDFAEMLMWCFAPTLAIKVRDAQLADHSLRSIAAQTDIVGIPFHDIKSALVKEWHLPALLTMLMDDANADNPRVRNVKLADDLARHAANGWDDAALPDDVRAVSELIHVGPIQLLHRLGLDAEQIERLSPSAAPETGSDQPQ
jgi:HD-like signal output (HDOD) protein